MKRKIIAPLVVTTALLSASLPYNNVLAVQPDHQIEKHEVKKWNENANVPLFVKEKHAKRQSATSNDALNYLEENKDKVKIKKPKAELKVDKSVKDEIGMTHVRFNQTKNGIPVEGAEVIVHYNANDEVTVVNGVYNTQIEESELDTTPAVSSEKALEAATSSVNAPNKLDQLPTSELVIYPFEGQNHLAYKVNVNFLGDEPGNWFVFVDAQSGNVIDKYNAIMDANQFKTQHGSGTGVLGDHRLLHITKSKAENEGTTFQLADFSHEGLEGILTYDYSNENGEINLFSNKSASFKSDYDRPAVDAHYNSEQVYDYYLDEHGRNSLDDNGMPIQSVVHFGENYNNAFWTGKYMVYGDGDGEFFIPLSASLDVAAHEMTHGVTSNSANLIYKFQSGALNEAFSDIFGALIDDSDWEIGEDIMAPDAVANGRESLRSLSDPSKYPVGSKYAPYGNGEGMYPSHMDEFYDLPGNLDNGGVHINSSIINHAAYLTAQDIGREKLGKIYYRALTQYLTPTSDFSNARQAIIQSAVDLYGEGSSEVEAATGGFDSVGITE
ncbi:M4 family metallopeptidase [Pseudalkalibacillus hwajinpoensis]|uniref:Neutral metalloproteinase n=1 Tax=Guptibacillus hwajinpoensis TaxID=208199 RepID=A0A4U1MEM7_9BACL|nr:M4 family metallopeptidase [Pseudalkalibacillus hwajinpoensis]TKD69207.1 peptidase M4 family protein [Pseudalkalibacillus hwajinpoensis]